MISGHFQGKPFNITVIQVYAPTTDTEEAEVDQLPEDLQCLLELTSKKDVLFVIEDWNAKVKSQEISRITSKFGLGVQNEAGQMLTEFCQENTLVTENTLFQHHKRCLYIWISPVVNAEVRSISSLQTKMENLYIVSKNKTWS